MKLNILSSPEVLRGLLYQLVGLDKRATFLFSLEPLGLGSGATGVTHEGSVRIFLLSRNARLFLILFFSKNNLRNET